MTVDEAISEEKRWYTVREAAEYLDVSEPTLFRWMKAGTLSFHKVGGSTRFTRQGLDAVVEKTTGEREAQAALGRCASCGNNEMVEGRLQGTGKLYFKPTKTKFWVLAESLVEMQARVCPACGHVQMHADTEKLGRLRPKGGKTS